MLLRQNDAPPFRVPVRFASCGWSLAWRHCRSRARILLVPEQWAWEVAPSTAVASQ